MASSRDDCCGGETKTQINRYALLQHNKSSYYINYFTLPGHLARLFILLDQRLYVIKSTVHCDHLPPTTKRLCGPSLAFSAGQLKVTLLYLHNMTDAFTISQDVAEVLGSQYITQSCLGQQTGGAIGILHIGDGCSCIIDSEVHHCIDSYSHTVFG